MTNLEPTKGSRTLGLALALSMLSLSLGADDREKDRRAERRESPISARLGDLERAIDDLRRAHEKEMQCLSRTIEAAGGDSGGTQCRVLRGTFKGRVETVVAVPEGWLRFLEVPVPTNPVVVGLQEAQAMALYQQAQVGIDDALLPTVFRSVPDVRRRVAAFQLQDRPVSIELARELVPTLRDENRISRRQAQDVIDALNARCEGEVRFDLPTEDELVVAARAVYDARFELLRPCHEVAVLAEHADHAGLLAHGWQLTRSPCEPYGADVVEGCPPNTFVIKGGTRGARNVLECIPEYRDAVPAHVAARDTTFRLVVR